MQTTIRKILAVRKLAALWITTIEDADGNTPTGVGNDFQVGEAIWVWFHDRFNKTKFSRVKPVKAKPD